jgi:uncharacterized membrane protein
MTLPPATRRRTADRPASRTALVIAGLGLLVSAYLTVEHFAGTSALACPESATINCAKVTTSQWSHIAGVPVAVLGLAYYLAVFALLLPRAWAEPRLDRVRVVAAVLGVVMVVYLLWIELFRVDAICLWCTAVHVCTVALLAVILWHTSVLRGPPAESR